MNVGRVAGLAAALTMAMQLTGIAAANAAEDSLANWGLSVEVVKTVKGAGYDETFIGNFLDTDASSTQLSWSGSRSGTYFNEAVGCGSYVVNGAGEGSGEFVRSSGWPTDWGLDPSVDRTVLGVLLPVPGNDFPLTGTATACDGSTSAVGGSEEPVQAPIFIPATEAEMVAAPVDTVLSASYAKTESGNGVTETTTVSVTATKLAVNSDSDGDTVPDADDACPSVVGSPTAAGCPDADNDTVPDSADLCPTEYGPWSLTGCPDADLDGSPDVSDQCPSDPGPVGTFGCPDGDNDGLPDNIDQCPAVAGDASNGGCPIADCQSTFAATQAQVIVETQLARVVLLSFQVPRDDKDHWRILTSEQRRKVVSQISFASEMVRYWEAADRASRKALRECEHYAASS